MAARPCRGYLFAEPMSASDVELLLKEGGEALQNVA